MILANTSTIILAAHEYLMKYLDAEDQHEHVCIVYLYN